MYSTSHKPEYSEISDSLVRAVLTFTEPLQTFCGSSASGLSQEETSSGLAAALGHITVVSKGPRDVITNGRVSLSCSTPGSPK
mgnify:CR=1 FL=1